MITKQLETVLNYSFEQKLQLTQKCKQKVTEQKKARICTEWRRARSRVAAQSRREKERELFREIAALLPPTSNMGAQLDKASVIRLTIAYLRLRAILDTPDSKTATTQLVSLSTGEPFEVNEKRFLNNAFGGFLLIVSLNGKVIYSTKEVISHTGINQTDLIGRSVFDFMHPSDQKELKEILTRLIDSQEQQKCEIFIRIKGSTSQKLTPWKVLHCTGVKKSSYAPGCSCLLMLCRSLPVQDVIKMEASLNFKTFLSVHSPDMRFTYCHPGILDLTNFSDTELYGQSLYQFCHPSDCQDFCKAHLCLLAKGQVYTGKYRLLHKHGGYVWVETEATVVYNMRTGKPESVVCISHVLSGVEMPDVVFFLEQTGHLLKSCDSFQHVHTPSTTSTVADMESSSVLPHCVRDGAADGHSVIMQNTAACNSLTCDICQLDLDSLAPYIPMDEEDFLLTPALENSDFNKYYTKPGLTLDSEQHPSLEKVILPSLQHSHSYYSNTNRVSKGLPGLLSSTHTIPHTANTTQQGVQCKCQNKSNHWMTDITKVLQPLSKRFGKNSDKSTGCCQTPPVSLPWTSVFSKLPQCPSRPFSQHTTQTREEKMLTAPVGLPILSRWECETNAPLEPTSHLLQGTDLTTVLDQVTPGGSWY